MKIKKIIYTLMFLVSFTAVSEANEYRILRNYDDAMKFCNQVKINCISIEKIEELFKFGITLYSINYVTIYDLDSGLKEPTEPPRPSDI